MDGDVAHCGVGRNKSGRMAEVEDTGVYNFVSFDLTYILIVEADKRG